ncbi:COG1470 family protein [Streptomyces sp. NPDC054887]
MQSPRRARRAGRLLAAAAVLLLNAAAPVPAAAAADRAPAWTAAPSGAGRPYFYLEGAAGTVFEDRLTLTNPGGGARTFVLRAEGADSGDWIALAATEVRIPARTRAEVPFTVTVPPGAAPGSHSAAIAASGGGRATKVPIHLRVSGPTLAALTVEDVTVRRRGDGAVIAYVLVNRGNTALAPRLAVRAEGLLGGELLRRAPRTLPERLAPGARVERTEPWPGAPALDAVDVRLTATAAGGARSEATASASFVPRTAVAVTALAVLGVAAGAVRRLRRRPRPPQDAAEPLVAKRPLAQSGAMP